jgi:endonuclease YncB( thermonuclease family)
MRSGFTRGQTLILVFSAVLLLAVLSGGGWLVWKSGMTSEMAPETVQPPQTPSAALPVDPSPSSHSPTAAVLETVAPLQTAPADAAEVSPTLAPFDPLACLPAGDQAREGKVLEVLSGAVLRVELNGKTSEVRLIGVDPAGPPDQDPAFLRELAAGKPVRLLPDGADRDEQGRLRRYVLSGQTFINYELVRGGYSLPALFPPGAACLEAFLTAERLARQEGLGYWALNPALPTLPAANGTASAPPCDCGVSYACTDFKTRSAAQACYNACGDYRNTSLDPDHNGQACEELP